MVRFSFGENDVGKCQQVIQKGFDFVHRVMARFISGNVHCIVDMKI
jgi:hypothetical protein